MSLRNITGTSLRNITGMSLRNITGKLCHIVTSLVLIQRTSMKKVFFRIEIKNIFSFNISLLSYD